MRTPPFFIIYFTMLLVNLTIWIEC